MRKPRASRRMFLQTACRLGARLGQSVVVDNKGRAGGTIGTTEIARAAAHGCTPGLAAQGTLVNNLVLYARPGYDRLKDFAFVAHAGDIRTLLPELRQMGLSASE